MINCIYIYAPQEVVNSFDELWNFQLPELKNNRYPYPELKFYSIADSEISVGSSRLSAKEVYHGFGKVDAIAFRLQTNESIFAYSGDTGECQGARQVCQDADIFICELSARIGDFESAFKYGHLNPYQAGSIVKETDVKKLVLVH